MKESKRIREYKKMVLDAVIEETGVDISTAESQNTRRTPDVTVRQIYFTLLRDLIPHNICNLEMISRMEHRKYNHATVIHAIKKMKDIGDVAPDDEMIINYKVMLGSLLPFLKNEKFKLFRTLQKVEHDHTGAIGKVVARHDNKELCVMFKGAERKDDFIEWINIRNLTPIK